MLLHLLGSVYITKTPFHLPPHSPRPPPMGVGTRQGFLVPIPCYCSSYLSNSGWLCGMNSIITGHLCSQSSFLFCRHSIMVRLALEPPHRSSLWSLTQAPPTSGCHQCTVTCWTSLVVSVTACPSLCSANARANIMNLPLP